MIFELSKFIAHAWTKCQNYTKQVLLSHPPNPAKNKQIKIPNRLTSNYQKNWNIHDLYVHSMYKILLLSLQSKTFVQLCT